MKIVLGVALIAAACSKPVQTRVVDPAPIEFRERALGMFAWAPPPRPRPKAVPKRVTPEPAELVPAAAPVAQEPEPVDPRDVQRRRDMADYLGRAPGPGITGVQAFGDGARGLVVFGEACSDEWIDANVRPMWQGLTQHGFLAVHCQGTTRRYSWPRRPQVDTPTSLPVETASSSEPAR